MAFARAALVARAATARQRLRKGDHFARAKLDRELADLFAEKLPGKRRVEIDNAPARTVRYPLEHVLAGAV